MGKTTRIYATKTDWLQRFGATGAPQGLEFSKDFYPNIEENTIHSDVADENALIHSYCHPNMIKYR